MEGNMETGRKAERLKRTWKNRGRQRDGREHGNTEEGREMEGTRKHRGRHRGGREHGNTEGDREMEGNMETQRQRNGRGHGNTEGGGEVEERWKGHGKGRQRRRENEVVPMATKIKGDSKAVGEAKKMEGWPETGRGGKGDTKKDTRRQAEEREES